jgi:hypothetical protein
MEFESAKPKKEKVEGDGRIAEDKSKHKGDWGKHLPDKDKQKDREEKVRHPWQKPKD